MVATFEWMSILDGLWSFKEGGVAYLLALDALPVEKGAQYFSGDTD